MELTQSLLAVIPVFLLIATGYIFASWKTINLASVTELIVYLGTPSLALSFLASRRIFLEEIMILSFGLLIIFAVVGLLVQIYFLVFRFRSVLKSNRFPLYHFQLHHRGKDLRHRKLFR